jgi:hypothetical protein
MAFPPHGDLPHPRDPVGAMDPTAFDGSFLEWAVES